MPDFITLPPPPATPNVTEPIWIENEYVVAAGDTRYSTTLSLMFDENSGFDGSDTANILTNAGTIWNEHSTGSAVFNVYNWGWIYNSGIIVANASNGQAQALVVGGILGGGLINAGSIYAVAADYANAVEYWWPYGEFYNSGTIAAKSFGGGAIAIRAFNGGEIFNDSTGSILAEGGPNYLVIAIDLYKGHWQLPGFPITSVDVANHGLIEARSTSLSQPAIAISANNFTGESMVIENFGVIRAGVAIYSSPYGFATTLQDAQQIIINRATGLIEGMIDISRGHDTVVNEGRITGLIDMGEGSDVVSNSGTITGEVELGAGTDIYDGRGGIQHGQVEGQDGADLLIGTAGQDILDGGAGEDVLVGGGGDTLTGGAGRDTFKFVTPGISVETITDFVSGTDVIDLRALAPTSVTISGSTVTATTAAGTLTIQVNGAVSQSDILTGGIASLVGSAGDDALIADSDGSELNGGAGSDLLVGGNGNDLLDGGSGPDMLWGGAGNDVYIVDLADNVDGVGDRVAEAAGEGVDTVYSSVSFTLGMNVENLTLTGSLPTDGGGNDLDNVIIGNSMSNNLSGGSGNDTLSGGNVGDVLRAGSGNDILIGDDGSDSLEGDSGEDTFIGTAAGLNGDTILDLSAGEKVVIVDANLADFAFSMSGSYGHGGRILTFTGGTINLNGYTGHFEVSAAAGGGIELTAVPTVRNDFDGDGRSDILWRNADGRMTDWLGTASGGFADNAGNAYNAVAVDWSIAGIGDFNDDGRSDILWRNNDGRLTDWLGTAVGGFSDNAVNALNSVSIDWRVAGIGDFNGDGRDDILWCNNDGRMTDWLATTTGGFSDNAANAYNSVSTDWQVVGVGDFNGDGRDDILWRNDDGRMTDWLGDAYGGFFDNAANAYDNVSTDWQVAGIGDFNGDGRDDILWRNDDGRMTDWLGNDSSGFSSNAANAYNSVGTDWQIASVGDFNGDGRDDILWRNEDGRMTNWLGTPNGGFSDNAVHAYGSISVDWHIQAPEII